MPEREVKDGMSSKELKAADVLIDVPYESGSSNPQDITYDKLDDEKGWAPPEGFTIGGSSIEDILADEGEDEESQEGEETEGQSGAST